jgi:acetate kinase
MTRVLTVNAGSSSLKLALLDDDSDQPIAQTEIPAPRATLDVTRLHEAISGTLRGADVVAHRIVHGGSRFRQAVLVDADVRGELEELTALAPLHQPKSLAALDAVSAALPQVPAVACFDTAFHATLSASAATFALPDQWRERWGLRRYGFHGLSYAHVAREVAATLGDDRRIVSCHLGSGASLCAIAGGLSVDTTMGFTPLDGLVMATRSGSVDPGLIIWLLEQTGISPGEMGSTLEHESGLTGLAGTGDMRQVLEARAAGDARAELAIGVYLHSLRAGVGAMAATLGGVDVIAFTGGVGENAAAIRAEAMTGLEFLAAREVCIHAREDLEMARQTRELLGTHRARRDQTT